MSETENNSGKFYISLRENGVHSLWRGIESYEEYDRTHDMMLLKDAIMHLHHGIELLMKEILVQHSAYLIFEDLRDASKKQKRADELGIGIFFLDRPPRTVTFAEAIGRVDAFVKPPELNNDLRANLDKLNRLRNQLEHYAIEADREEVTQLLAVIRDPLLDLFEAQIGGIKELQTPRVSRVWNSVQDSARLYSQREQEVFALIQRFTGQRVPGYLLNVEGEFTLPTFTQVLPNYRLGLPQLGIEIDLLGEGEGFRWVIEIKGSLLSTRIDVLDSLVLLNSAAQATPWLVVFSAIPEKIRKIARQRNILVTGASEWQELKQLVESE